MKLIFIGFVFITSQSFSQATDSNFISQKAVNKTVKEISKIIKKKSIFSDSLNWREINQEIHQISLNVKSKKDLEVIDSFFIQKLRGVGDKHSFFLTKNEIAEIKVKPQESKQANSKYLQNGIAYINVPSCMTMDDEKDKDFANNIRTQIQKIDTENDITGWIVDLRHNLGGNMWPMIAGLNALISDGIVGYFVFPSSKQEIGWKSTNGVVYSSGKRIDTYKIRNPGIKIAVVIDSLTGSSGEMTAISFSGLPNVKFFGSPTAGYTTANRSFNLSNGTQLYLATSFVADRNHKKFMDNIIPDEIVKAIDKNKDETLKIAKQWLKDAK